MFFTLATLALLQDDPQYWGDRPQDALYLHKFAVRRDRAGRGVGAAIVEWANAEAAEAGREFLRLDCLCDNPRIRDYYEDLGFEHRGDLVVGADRLVQRDGGMRRSEGLVDVLDRQSGRLGQLLLRRLAAELDLAPGLVALTGETGAGKTIVTQAIGLLLGAKGDAAAVGPPVGPPGIARSQSFRAFGP